MADKIWRSVPGYWPTDGQTVWVRVANHHQAPFQATFRDSDQTFLPGNMAALFTSPTVLPWWVITEWREL